MQFGYLYNKEDNIGPDYVMTFPQNILIITLHQLRFSLQCPQ